MKSGLSIETSRLKLTSLAQQDLSFLYEVLIDSFVRRYLCDKLLSRMQIKDFLRISIRTFQKEQWGLWRISPNDSKMAIGLTGLWRFLEAPQPELLCALLPNYA